MRYILVKTLLREFRNLVSEKISMQDDLMFYDLQYPKTGAQYFYQKIEKYR